MGCAYVGSVFPFKGGDFFAEQIPAAPYYCCDSFFYLAGVHRRDFLKAKEGNKVSFWLLSRSTGNGFLYVLGC